MLMAEEILNYILIVRSKFTGYIISQKSIANKFSNSKIQGIWIQTMVKDELPYKIIEFGMIYSK
ncbi:MAG: hypothetical protein ACI9FN_001728 [Saprospiraceae bacterium]|jgi:hypothetical protein